MTYLSLTLPGNQTFNPPAGLPSGGLNLVSKIIGNVSTILIILAVVLSLFFLIWAGMQWVTSGGDKTKLAAARARLTWAIIGLVIVFGAFFILNVIGYIFKVNLLSFSAN